MATLTEEELHNLDKLTSSKNKKRLLKLGKYAMRAGQLGAYMAGQHDLADEFREGAHGFKEAGTGHHGAGRKAASSFAGGQAAKFAQGKGLARKAFNKTKYKGKVVKMSGGKSAALGGAISGAMQGESLTNIAKSSASWYLLYTAFTAFWVSILTLFGWIIPFLYLNAHFLASKLGSKLFGEFSIAQKVQLAVIDLGAILLVVLLLVIFIVWPLYIVCNPQGLLSLLEAFDYTEYIGVPKQVCDSLNSVGGSLSGVTGSVAGIVESGLTAMCIAPEILAQQNNAPHPRRTDPDLDRLVSCIRTQAPDAGGVSTFEQGGEVCNYTRGAEICGQCAYPVNSCHYGGALGKTGALASDFAGSEGVGNEAVMGGQILQAAQYCSEVLGIALNRAVCETVNADEVSCADKNADHVYISLRKCEQDSGPINSE